MDAITSPANTEDHRSKTVQSQVSSLLGHGSLPLWTQEAVEHMASLEGRLVFVSSTEHRSEIQSLIDAAAELVVQVIPRRALRRRLSNWWNGTPIELVWAYLHEADLRLIEYADSRGLEICLETAVLHASVLAADDPTRVRLEELVKDLEGKRLEDLVSERTPEPPASGSRRARPRARVAR